MKRRFLMLVTVFVLLAAAVIAPALGQEDGELACDADELTIAIEEAAALLEEAGELAGDDPASALTKLVEARLLLTDSDIKCHDLAFEGAANAVLGPIDLPTGVYRVTFTTEGFGIADAEPLEGKCETDMFGLFNVSAGEAQTGAEAMLKAKDCRALIEITNIQKPWTLTIELIQ